jgi:hypothetical protein
MSSNLEVIFEPKSENYDPNDSRWIEQVNDLVMDCTKVSGNVHKEVIASEGTKGGFEDLIMVLGSSGVITAVAGILKSWISLDRTRSLILKIKDDDRIIEYEVSGKGLSKDTINGFMEKAIELQNKRK